MDRAVELGINLFDTANFMVIQWVMANHPKAPGSFRVDNYEEGYGNGITWRISHKNIVDWSYN